MLDLHITWPDGEARFTPADSPVQIGRSSEAKVTLTQASVSRRHLELTWDGQRWQARDSSTHGSYDLDGVRRPTGWPIANDVSLRLGGTEGVGVQIRLVPSATPAGDDDRVIVLDDGSGSSPGGRPGGAPGPVGRSGRSGHEPRVPTGSRSSVMEASPVGEEAPGGPGPDPGPRILSDGPPASSPVGSTVPGPTGTQPAIAVGSDAEAGEGSALRLSVDGQEYSFLPGAEVTVGRDPSCLVQLEERHSLVSRRHLRIVHRDGGWWIEDYSSKGTWVDHRRLRGPYRAQGSFVAHLGDDDAGTPMRIATAGNHRAAPSSNMILIGVLAAAVLIPLLALAILLAGGDDEPDFATAKKATVVLFGLEGGQGSGFFVDDNLILTNQHVAALSSQLLVGVSRDLDEPAQIEYATELVTNHPFLDIAVLRVSNRAVISSNGPQISSDPVGDIDLPMVELGDSSELAIGDEVFSTGFPGRLGITSTNEGGELRLPAVVATRGEVANFGIWPGCNNPDLATFIPADSPPGVTCSRGGDIERGVYLSTFSSGQGASGSPVFRDNQVVGVVYAGAPEEANASLNIATSTFQPWLDEIIAANP
jgi:pSer/pThr/pTyr-binding forkhead associated (FHA) protein